MIVEILYFAGCPNHPPTVGRVLEALQLEEISAGVFEVEIKDAATARVSGFLGSPSVRINGRDVETAARSAKTFGLTCIYIEDDCRVGVPPIEWIRAAIREANEQV